MWSAKGTWAANEPDGFELSSRAKGGNAWAGGQMDQWLAFAGLGQGRAPQCACRQPETACTVQKTWRWQSAIWFGRRRRLEATPGTGEPGQAKVPNPARANEATGGSSISAPHPAFFRRSRSEPTVPAHQPKHSMH